MTGLVKRYVRMETATLPYLRWLGKKHEISGYDYLNKDMLLRELEKLNIGNSFLITYVEGSQGKPHLIPITGLTKIGDEEIQYAFDEAKRRFISGEDHELFRFDDKSIRKGDYGTSNESSRAVMFEFYSNQRAFDEFRCERVSFSREIGGSSNENSLAKIDDRMAALRVELAKIEDMKRQIMADIKIQEDLRDFCARGCRAREVIRESNGDSSENGVVKEGIEGNDQIIAECPPWEYSYKLKLPVLFTDETDGENKFTDVNSWFTSITFLMDLQNITSRKSRLANLLANIGGSHQGMVTKALKLKENPTENDVLSELLKILNYNKSFIEHEIEKFQIDSKKQLMTQFHALRNMVALLYEKTALGKNHEITIDQITLREFKAKLPKIVSGNIIFRLGIENKKPLEIVELAQKILDCA